MCIEEQLAATLGLYDLHKLLIRLGPDVKLVGDDDKPTPNPSARVLSIFAHEYFHYLHNFSTVAGFATFEIVQQLLAIFSITLDDSGVSTGNSELTVDQIGIYGDCLERLRSLYGDPLPNFGTVISLTATGVVESKERVAGVDVHVAKVSWRIQCMDGPHDVESRLGYLAITEGIAYESEDMLLRQTTAPAPWAASVPLYPYSVLRALGTLLAPSAPRESLVRLAVLALCFNRPGAALATSLRRYEFERKTGASDSEALTRVLALTEEYRSACLTTIVERSLPELHAMHAGRGLGEAACKTVSRITRDLIGRRRGDPFFDLAWAQAGSVDLSAFQRLIHELVPCDIVQEHAGNEEQPRRDRLYTFGAGEAVTDRFSGTESIGAHHAQLSMLFAHLMSAGFRESAHARSKCPFYTSCPHDRRIQCPGDCAERPWSAFSTTEQTCWYGAAVGSTLGTVTFSSS
jgi:hypothetical protein